MASITMPRRVRWIFSITLFFLVTMELCRLLFFWGYRHQASIPLHPAFLMGLRFDLKFAGMLGLFLLVFSTPAFFDPFSGQRAGRFWTASLTLIWGVLLLFYAVDYFHYDYLHQRLNASVLNYLQDASISMGMVGQTYPVFPMLIVMLLLMAGGWYIIRRVSVYSEKDASPTPQRPALFFVAQFFIFAALVFGKPGQYNLRWSDAFTLGDNFSAQLALNPFQSFFSTLKYRSSMPDRGMVRKYYPLISRMLGANDPDTAGLTYNRRIQPADTALQRPNVVLVLCESFSAYKSSAFGNPLHTTPFFDSLAGRGILFDRCFTPAYGTARGVWALITGIPDVEEPRTASRNPDNVNQRTLLNEFTGYEKFYFLGGNPSWANIQGLLSNNIQDLHMYMQYDFKAPKIDVWGISDHDLFLEANGILKRARKPFFAIIQTADNHRPYTIPEADARELGLQKKTRNELHAAGFESNEEFNAFRYTDLCIRKFMEAASREAYFSNTLFVFIGDHGIRGDAGNMLPAAFTRDGLTCEHVPLLFYVPSRNYATRSSRICSQVDVMPSIASLAGISCINTTMGRDLFSPLPLQDQTAFIFDVDMHTIGTIAGDHYYYRNLKSGQESLVSIKNEVTVMPAADSIRKHLNEVTTGWYHTARYLLRNNKKKF
jgi:phosphoglycerol transferase MdoB-like AlkP superfamily enzyme